MSKPVRTGLKIAASLANKEGYASGEKRAVWSARRPLIFMKEAEKLAAFVVRARFDDLSDAGRTALKIRVLDTFGCAIGALGSTIASRLRIHTDEFGGNRLCTLLGGGFSAPDRAAFFNTALARYLDFNDSYLAKGETCHPSDNLGAVLAACEFADGNGRDFLTALALAYQVQCRLSDVAPVRDRGFDHTTQGAYAIAAGVAKSLRLDQAHTAHALAICGTGFNALRVTRTGALSNWKGLAYANTAFCCTHATFLARHGITGPLEVFEGNKGFMQTIAGRFEIDWAREDLERVTRTIVKKYNAEIHSQSAIEGALELKREYGLTGREVERVDIDIFDVAFHIIGGGEEGDKRIVQNKEEADHSLPYLIAVALLDGSVMPAQFLPARIHGADVQTLLQKIHVRPSEEFSRHFPQDLRCRLNLHLEGGRTIVLEKRDYEGFTTRPSGWETVVRKFRALAEPHVTSSLQTRIVDAVANLETNPVRRLTDVLHQVTPAPLDREEGVVLYGP
jgi:2-methylcitrate dehydratase